MRKSKKWKAAVLAAAMMVTAVSASGQYRVYAEEEITGEEALPEGEGEAAEGEMPAEEAAAQDQGTVMPGTILANNGLYIANTFPDSMMPEGFHRQTVAYEGQNIDLAFMDNGNNLVVLAYLTDASGMTGDFYLCDTATAMMTDYVKFDGGNGKFLIVLDPGDNVNPPAGFNRANLNVNNKVVVAWTLPDGTSAEEEKSEEARLRFTETVYGAGLDIGAGAAGAGGNDAEAAPVEAAPAEEAPAEAAPAEEPAQEAAPDVDVAAAQAAEAQAASIETDASGFIKALPSQFFLVYGIDQSGLQGFYLYDTLGQTYQRYVEIDYGESEETEKFRKSAQIRLFIIAGLVVFAVVLLFIIINMALSGRKGGSGGYDEDDDDDVEAMKKRVRTKEKKALKRNGRRFVSSRGGDDYDDGDDEYEDENENEDEDIRYYNRSDMRTGRGVRSTGRGGYDEYDEYAGYQDRETYQDPMQTGRGGQQWEEDEYDEAPQRQQGGSRQDIDLDDDFHFDFLKPKN
ncbi:MAG: hypothetical protein K6F35_11290 [Lachnospiraceae bacterium]|nr:hypothetical protein [Lachnospiraceae bacterium]